jgi:hypothetical protein
MDEKTYMDLDDEILLFCAFRYALGRQTYVVSTVIGKLIKEFENIDPINRKKYVQEIDEAISDNHIGSDYDKEDWLKVKALFTPENHYMVKAYTSQENMNNDISSETLTAIKHDGKYYSMDMKSFYPFSIEVQ